MFVTNLSKSRLGLSGTVIMAPGEVNLYVSDNDVNLVTRVLKLQAAGLVSVVKEAGLTKTGITGKVVKTLGVDAGGVGKAPRSAKRTNVKPVEETADEIKVEVKEEEEVAKPEPKRTSTRKSAKVSE